MTAAAPEAFTTPHLQALKVGDVFETTGPFLGVSDDPVRWLVTGEAPPSTKASSGYLMMTARYLGVSLGEFNVSISRSGKVKVFHVET